ncbi:hypothetical protein BDV09DRAFT_193289 [Aspergillus tetrazonus]
MVWASDASQLKALAPAVEMVKSFLSSSSTPDASVHFHVFSNAGSHAAVQLVNVNNWTYLEPGLCIHSLILDSCPGSQSAVHSANAMILGHPRNFIVSTLGAVLIYLVIAAVALLDALGVSENVVSKTRRHLNDPARDRMVPWKEILDYLKKPRTDFEVPLLKVRYGLCNLDSGHVGHLVDDAKYRDAIFQG